MKLTRGTMWRLALLLFIACTVASAGEFGTIRGRFLLQGQVPDSGPLVVDKDMAVCGKCEIPNEELVVGADKGVANVVVYICSKDIPLPSVCAPEPTIVEVVGCRYKPHVTVVQAGQEFIIRNNDPVGHNANVATIKIPPSGSIMSLGRDDVRTFSHAQAKPVQVTCNIHPWMEAWVLIHDNPYACVSDEGGVFEIADVPNGKWELRFWHEKCGYFKEVSIAGKTQVVPKGRMEISVDGKMNNFGDIVLDAKKLVSE